MNLLTRRNGPSPIPRLRAIAEGGLTTAFTISLVAGVSEREMGLLMAGRIEPTDDQRELLTRLLENYTLAIKLVNAATMKGRLGARGRAANAMNRFSFVAATLLAVGACGDPEYTYTQREDGLAMKAPITHTVRIRLDTVQKTVTWLQDSKDSEGVENRQLRRYGGVSVSTCRIFDRRNWDCAILGPAQEEVEKPVMKDGQLTRWYWASEEKYQTRHRVFGWRLPR